MKLERERLSLQVGNSHAYANNKNRWFFISLRCSTCANSKHICIHDFSTLSRTVHEISSNRILLSWKLCVEMALRRRNRFQVRKSFVKNVFLDGPHLHLVPVHSAAFFLNRIKDVLSCIRKGNYFPTERNYCLCNFVERNNH